MTKIYTQLRVSCGLSAIVNATQPHDLRISPNSTFAHWLDIQWLKLTNNNDENNPLVGLCYAREHKWVAVLDYILLRKISSSFKLCKGISPGVLTTEAAYEDLNWTTLTKVFTVILTRLNQNPEDWPLWHYDGKLDNPEKNLEDEKFRKESLKLIQSVKMFYEYHQSNYTIGLEAEWKQAINSLGAQFPEKVTPQAVYNHLDYYKTNFELGALLETLGYEADTSFGSQYPTNVKANSIVLIARPGHWVCEDNSNQGARHTVLDSLTAGTDSLSMGENYYYFKPIENLKFLKQILPKLGTIFPDVDIELPEEEGLTEFPPLVLPVTEHPAVTALDYHSSSQSAYEAGDFKNALLDKRIECALLEKTDNFEDYFNNLIEFTEWCYLNDRTQTAQENMQKLTELENKLKADSIPEIIGFHKLKAKVHSMNQQYVDASKEYALALEIYDNDAFEGQKSEIFYELANGLGVSYARIKEYKKAIESFKKAKNYALLALEEDADKIAEYELGPPIKYWPAIIRGLDNKIDELTNIKPAISAEKID